MSFDGGQRREKGLTPIVRSTRRAVPAIGLTRFSEVQTEVWIVPLHASEAHTEASNTPTPKRFGRTDRRGLQLATCFQ